MTNQEFLLETLSLKIADDLCPQCSGELRAGTGEYDLRDAHALYCPLCCLLVTITVETGVDADVIAIIYLLRVY